MDHVYLVGVYILTYLKSSVVIGLESEELVKYITTETEVVRIGCPHGHVIYDPDVIAGVLSDHNDTRTRNDCTGTPKRLQDNLDKCFLKKSCDITIERSDTVDCKDDCTRRISYIVFKKMFCAPREYVMDICTIQYIKPNDFPQNGVIRSHKNYPRRRPKSRSCNTEISIDRQSSLILVPKYTGSNRNFRLTQVLLNNTEKVVMLKELLLLHGNSTKAVRIEVNFRKKRKSFKGFLLSYSFQRSKGLDKYLSWPMEFRPALRELGWIFEVRPVIEQCSVGIQGRMDLTCNPGEVIYFPSISVSGHDKHDASCIFGKYPCGGLTTDLIVQENECYWKNSCSIKWERDSRILLSSDLNCIGYMASVMGTSGHRCVHRDNIYDICTDATRDIDAPWGIIRSHRSYPWILNSDCDAFKRKIKVGRKRILTLAVQDMDLDPDGRDKFFVYHVKKKRSKLIKIADSKAREGTIVRAKGGEVIVKFKRYQQSVSGRGFVLVFYRFSTVSRRREGPKSLVPPGNDGLLNDASSREINKLSNWRLCSKENEYRKRGRACNKRVWTDYYKRLA